MIVLEEECSWLRLLETFINVNNVVSLLLFVYFVSANNIAMKSFSKNVSFGVDFKLNFNTHNISDVRN